jgi:23S rRNA (adenine2503-C2)-methyltransferase
MKDIEAKNLPLRPFILDFDREGLAQVIAEWGEPSYRVQQIWEGLYRHFWQSADQFGNLPQLLRNKLAENFDFTRLQQVSELRSADRQTVKILFRLPNNSAIESVLMKYQNRRTLCISSQAGCAMGCIFCATGQMGLQSNLSAGEIIEQVLFFARQLQSEGKKVSNVVVMGMGEPFNNYEATLSAIGRLNHPQGFNFGSRRFTISTVGLVPFIKRFTREDHQINLAISLHAADDELRSSLMPINKRYPLKSLFEACLDYVSKTRRRISFEWALIDGVNDDLAQAEKLSNWLSPFRIGDSMLCHVNLIPLNPTFQYSRKPADNRQTHSFKVFLTSHGIPCTIRLRRGIDIQAGCGQLAVQTRPSRSV